MSLYHELKRRNVFRVAIGYLALAWLLTEVSGTLFPAFGIPDWGVRFVVIVFALGFVPALIISWVYELTPEGLKREKDVVRDASITHLTAKRLDVFTIGLIVVAFAFILADRLWLSPRFEQQITKQTTACKRVNRSPGQGLNNHGVGQRVGRGAVHHSVHGFAGFAMQARRIDKNDLCVVRRVNGENSMTCSLWLGRYDTDFTPHHSID